MSEQALRLIEENKRTRAPFLDLGNCGLTTIPNELGELVWLESLSLATEWFVEKDLQFEATVSRNYSPAWFA